MLTLAPVAIFSGGPMIIGAPMMNSGMSGGAAMVVMLLLGAAVLFAWVLGLAAVEGLAIWGVRSLSARGGL